jgi:hypothetical protein
MCQTIDQIYHSWLPDDHLKRGHRILEASMKLKADRCQAPLFLFLSRVLKIVVFSHHERQHSEQELHVHQELLVVYLWSHEFTGTDLSASPLPVMPLSMVCHQIFRV